MKVSLRKAKAKFGGEAESRIVQLINMLIDGFYDNKLHKKEQEFVGLNIRLSEYKIECVEQYADAIHKLKKALTQVRKSGGEFGDYYLISKQ